MKWQDCPGWGQRTLVMGIINATPDSFSGDGVEAVRDAVAQAECQLDAGADILDVGGESTRPGANRVCGSEERARVLPVISEILDRHPKTVISIDTYRAETAAAAIDAGASIVNDIHALSADADMPAAIAERKAVVVLMHNRSRSSAVRRDRRIGAEYEGVDYGHVIEEVAAELRDGCARASAAGIISERIAVDPGIGFGKSVLQNLALINHLDRLKRETGFPTLIGPSRKSFIGRVLDMPVEERLEGTLACIVAGVLKGADIVRVHDVAEAARAVRMADAIRQAPEDAS